MLETHGHRSVKDLVENLLFLATEPLSLKRMTGSLAHSSEEISAALDALQAEYSDRGLKLRYTSGGWEITTDPALAPEIESFYNLQKRKRLSKQAIETLTVIAYNQPITRAEIETVRGVGTSGTLQTLIECDMVKVVGQRETVGNPFLYGTTVTFLMHFGLGDISELPPLEFDREGISKPVFRTEQVENEGKDGSEPKGEITPVDFGLVDESVEISAHAKQKGA